LASRNSWFFSSERAWATEKKGKQNEDRKIDICRLRVPLKKPYKIATAEMKYFDMTLVAVQVEGREGLGEAMAGIEGYFWETPDEVWALAKSTAPNLVKLEFHAAYCHLNRFIEKNPCAVTPFITSLEMASLAPTLSSPPQNYEVPMVGILQASDKTGIEKEVRTFLDAGYDTIKIKVGFDPKKDIAQVKMAQDCIQGKALIRVDANQGYQFSQAKEFVLGIDPQGIEFFEQPFKESEWEAMIELAKISPIPLGLDESIYGMESVEKARRLKCCRFVKFKLMKISSAETLAANIKKCQEYGFGVVLGNGAAGEINCYLEALVASRTINQAGEMNGFLKQTESILVQPLKTSGGKILLDPKFTLKLDEKKVSRFTIEQFSYS
jgi:L-Ala-D/L-Glu epimerase